MSEFEQSFAESDLTSNFETEKPMGQVSVQEIEVMIKDYKEQKEAVEQAEYEVGKLKEIQVNTEKKLLAFLNEFKKTSYKSTWGMVVKTGRWSWKTPKTEEARKNFFAYLKKKKVYDQLITVNSNTLNSFAKGELEAAKEAGDIDFEIPGLEEPNYTERVALRKK
jgi:flavodoxin